MVNLSKGQQLIIVTCGKTSLALNSRNFCDITNTTSVRTDISSCSESFSSNFLTETDPEVDYVVPDLKLHIKRAPAKKHEKQMHE
jgi:hypothetical protein